MTFEEAKPLLAKHDQSHLLDFWDQLDDEARESLLGQIKNLDFSVVAAMRAMVNMPVRRLIPSEMEPADVAELEGEARDAAHYAGTIAIRDGRVGVILVAGGQGSRLGFDAPKGFYPIGPVTNAPLFAFHARKVLAIERRLKTKVPLYVMTSPENEERTIAFFEERNYFGLKPSRVKFFSQAMWPALDPEGKIILDEPGHIFEAPDGHGGMMAALGRSGCLDDMRKRGLTTIFYFQVDNPLVDIPDPVFIGHHLRNSADYSIKVCTKRNADEALGVVVVREGKTLIVEYSELSQERKSEKREDGRLNFLYGSVAIHAFSVSFLERMVAVGLPLHRAHKRIPYCDAQGETVFPDEPNAYKFEKFIFDALMDSRVTTCMAFKREDEFSPVKNAEGVDTPATCRRDLSTKWARWLRSGGVPVALDKDGYAVHRIEIDPCYAIDAQSLRERLIADKPELNPDGDISLVHTDE